MILKVCIIFLNFSIFGWHRYCDSNRSKKIFMIKNRFKSLPCRIKIFFVFSLNHTFDQIRKSYLPEKNFILSFKSYKTNWNDFQNLFWVKKSKYKIIFFEHFVFRPLEDIKKPQILAESSIYKPIPFS